MSKTLSLAVVTLFVVTASLSSAALAARDQIRIVGSSTVYPFSTAVAEEFGNSTKYRTPVVESTGSGGGLKLFCAGIGADHPDITNASRRIKASEIEACADNGIEATEIKIGYDGIVLANASSSPVFKLSLRQIYLALAKMVPGEDGELVENPYQRWNEIDPSLPDYKIEVLGPPPTSGTRDAFNELAIEGGCKTFPEMKALKSQDKSRYKALCRGIREDGAYVEAGENDNLIVQKLQANGKALGVFGFSFLDQNRDSVHGSLIGGVEPTFETIASGEYPISRSMYFYIKNAHVGSIPGIREYAAEFTSDRAAGEFGYLTEKGLIPLPEDDLAAMRARVQALEPIRAEDLKKD